MSVLAAPLGLDQAPWLSAWRLLEGDLGVSLEALAQANPADRLARLNRAASARGLEIDQGRPLQFVVQGAAPGAALTQSALSPNPLALPYERVIALSGTVPTRVEGPGAVHDLLNALAWLSFPRTKRAMHRLQDQAICADGISGRRGALRDGITLLDENGLLLAVAHNKDRDRLRAHDWSGLLVRERGRWVDAAVATDGAAALTNCGAAINAADDSPILAVPIGHGLVERLIRPYPALTAHVRVVRMPRAWFGLPATERLRRLDRALAARLLGQTLRPAMLAPLPVLGIPGWWAANAHPDFYVDARVFRPRRGAK